ncbi:glycosyltransferase [Bifidobacterium criceti]|uniref:Glycosyl transferase n=1 Tax=Bifidobacterium criceti TaxID=1960969 RepID=A0A2A2EJ20_9BIFI|nr:glycosyltransferase [Bifidobacterium criceti]PAU68997.1 glycosyl transferase [Bifidobacterium criceti]
MTANVRFGFVVLHYLVDDETAKCIDSIRQLPSNHLIHITVVDNNSDNGSYERLLRKYDGVSNIHFIHNSYNLGFAQGNNIGYKYCVETLKCNFVCVINNDACVKSDNFVDLCVEDAQNPCVGVVGPDIQSGKNDIPQNPVYSIIDTPKALQKFHRYLICRSVLSALNLFDLFNKVVVSRKRGSNVSSREPAQAARPYKLHGACLVFTPSFIGHFNEPFDSRTFLYLEEDILYIRCKKDGLTMLYDSRIKVYHREDASTDAQVKHSDYLKELNTMKYQLQSYNVLKEYIK